MPWDDLIVDPGFGFGKTAEHNLALLRELGALRVLGRPILLGTSRKSTLGSVLDLPADQRLEAHPRHDGARRSPRASTSSGSTTSQANVRAARMSRRGRPRTWRSRRPKEGP